MMEKILCPLHPARVIFTGPSDCGKSYFLTNLFLNKINEYDKINIFSPRLHQDLYRKLYESFSNYIPINKLPNIFNEEDIDVEIDEIINDKVFEKSGTEIET